MTPILTAIQHTLLASAVGRPDIGYPAPPSPLARTNGALLVRGALRTRAPR